MMPEKGDRVRVTFEGEYSHRGGKAAYSHNATGFHLIDVPGKLGWHTASVPPDATVEVLEKALPPEPPMGAMVTLNVGLPYSIYHRSEKGWVLLGYAEPRYTWRELNERGRPIRRVYVDPLADAPEPPFYVSAYDQDHRNGSRSLLIAVDDVTGQIQIGAARLEVGAAQKVAKAILAAAGGFD